MRRTAWDQHTDAFEGLKATCKALSHGESRLGLPALGGLFARGQTPQLTASRITNRRLLAAIWRLTWFRPTENQPLTRVNWRDMETEELGRVYEGLLELTPRASAGARTFAFAEGYETRGHARRTTGSYYTPEALVKTLLDSAIDPLLEEAEARNPVDPAVEILKLTIVDPACGSGHFLLGAARRAAARIAKLRSPGAPSQMEFQHALREVVSHCIYGVDRNPLAVELCKVALWIEALEPDKPLSFLDARIRCGDSLVGITDLSVLQAGIPDEAYRALSGDAKEVAAHFKKVNKNERDKRPSLDIVGPPKDLADAWSALDAMPEDSVPDIDAKRKQFERLRSGGLGWRLQRACDLWTAAFFAPKNEIPAIRGRELVPTTDKVWQYLRGVTFYGPLMAEVNSLAEHCRFFHWPIEFTDVMARGDFDLVLGNPPWEAMSPYAKEFFAAYDPGVRFMSPEDQQAAYNRLLETPAIAERWNRYCRDLYTQVQFYKESGRYRLFAPGNLGKGDLNVYRMFAETALHMTRKGGCAAQFVPEGFYKGANAAALRSAVFNSFNLKLLVGFVNKRAIWFPSVHQQFEFCLYVAIKDGQTTDFEAAFRVDSHDRLAEVVAGHGLRIPLSMVAEFSPDAMAIMEFSAQQDIDICRKMYERYPRFGDEIDGVPYRSYMREVDMGTDRGLLSEDVEGLPVFEGRMVDSYDYRAKGYASGRGRSADWVDLPFGSPDKSIRRSGAFFRMRYQDKLLGGSTSFALAFAML